MFSHTRQATIGSAAASYQAAWSHRSFFSDVLRNLALKSATLVVAFDSRDALSERGHALILEEALVRIGYQFDTFAVLVVLDIEAVFQSGLLDFGVLLSHDRRFEETLLKDLFVSVQLAQLVVHRENVTRVHSVAHVNLVLDLFQRLIVILKDLSITEAR